MSNNNHEYVRKTIRIPRALDIRIQQIMHKEHFIAESELIRHLLTIGCKKIEDEMHERKDKKN